MTQAEKILYIDKQIARIAAKHRRAILQVIRGYGASLKKALEKNQPQTVIYNMALIMPIEPMRDALILLWLDAGVKFTNLTSRELTGKTKYRENEFEVKKDPRVILAERLAANPELQSLYMTLFSYFQGEGAARVVTIVDTYREQGIKAIQEALMDITTLGLGEKEAGELLARYVDESWRKSLFQSDRIVRTETHAAANYSSLNEAVNTQAQVLKVWGAFPDKRTRPTHIEADGQTRELNHPFNVGGVSLMTPGDPKVRNAPQETISCRCVILYQRKKGAL